jgi:hypothetical protein
MPELEVAFLTQAGALLKLAVLSMLLERSLAFVFEHDWFARLVHAPRLPAADLPPRFVA